jgi:putative addiction module killer protein
MNIFFKSEKFNDWLASIKDKTLRATIFKRIRMAGLGNFGDCKPVGEGVHEMRIYQGAGYRLYYTRLESVTYWLLIGGDKSTQQRDIEKAIELAKNLKEKHT